MDSNHCTRICNPLPHHSVNCPLSEPFYRGAHFLFYSPIDILMLPYGVGKGVFSYSKKIDLARKTPPSWISTLQSFSVTRNLRRVLPLQERFILRKYNYIFELGFYILLLTSYQPFRFKEFYLSMCMF